MITPHQYLIINILLIISLIYAVYVFLESGPGEETK